ncbi:MAG: ABC transporter permease [Prevotellaceae bacterium]|jgi:hypothetical protein|nr:ABC transporter permease [Prevotellaceae bacterium]
MIRHYLKIAFRNLWKYKNQTLVSVISLAVGFVCFAIATFWIRYEMSYDNFHKNADRLYCVYVPSSFSATGKSRNTYYPLAGYLKARFPEIVNATAVAPHTDYSVEIEGIRMPVDILEIDSSFFSIFDVKIVEGSMEFMIRDSRKMAITREKASQLFGNESPLGKIVKSSDNSEYTVCAVVTGLPKRSNYPFDFLMPHKIDDQFLWAMLNKHTLVELVRDADVEAFEKKLNMHIIHEDEEYSDTGGMSIMPLTTIRYKDVSVKREVKFQHIVIFSIVGLLLILCALFNYLTLFISRFRIRRHELALRIVCGASNRSLFTLLSVEFLMSLFFAVLLGLLSAQAIVSVFIEISGVKMSILSICLESLMYIAGIILISLLTFIVSIAIFRRQTLNANIRRSNSKLFRKVSIVAQLVICIIVAFSAIVVIKQMYYLHNTDLGFAFKDRGSVYIANKSVAIDMEMLNNKIQQLPEITQTVKGYRPLLPYSGGVGHYIKQWDDMPTEANRIVMEEVGVSGQFLEYYEFQLVEGEMLNDRDNEKQVLINESAVKFFGWEHAVGKSFGYSSNDRYIVKGVLKNAYTSSPSIIDKLFIYRRPMFGRNGVWTAYEAHPYILFKCNENAWKICRDKIEAIVEAEYPNSILDITSAEEEYDKFLKSENILLQILVLISIICVIICVFGFVSIVSLTCEERRKEIAIRKINGATVKDILDIFFKEYLTLLIAGALIAFPAGYLIMKRWLENYVVQTDISAWLYISILLALIIAIVLCVGGKVLKTSRVNPAEAIKS